MVSRGITEAFRSETGLRRRSIQSCVYYRVRLTIPALFIRLRLQLNYVKACKCRDANRARIQSVSCYKLTLYPVQLVFSGKEELQGIDPVYSQVCSTVRITRSSS